MLGFREDSLPPRTLDIETQYSSWSYLTWVWRVVCNFLIEREKGSYQENRSGERDYKQTRKQTDKHTHRQTDRQTNRQRY